MDDHDNQTPSDQVFPNVPFSQTLNLEGRVLEASVVYGLQPDQIDSALELALGRERENELESRQRLCTPTLIPVSSRLLRPEQPFSQYTSWTCHDPLTPYTPDGPTQMMLAPES
eukprot:3259827-Amphidinium_carterae.1